MAYSEHTVWMAGLYARLSREDGDKMESDSIGTQLKMLYQYTDALPEISVYDTYTDDGYTGTNFNRPDFQRLIQDIEAEKVNCVIVKDLSRFGRNYKFSGYYLEEYFEDKGVRFIAVCDGVDSVHTTGCDMIIPMKNVFNEQYARDISRKVQAAFKTKQKAGEFVGAFACYGYKKSPADRHKLVIDEYAAGVVRRIFRMFREGAGQMRIARTLNEEGILCPSAYKRAMGLNYRNCNKLDTTNYWTYSTIHNILKQEMYIGNIVQGKTRRRMKGKPKALPKELWVIKENQHEAIIDMDTWETVQRLLAIQHVDLKLNENVSIFAGFLKCADCGRALAKRKDGNVLTYKCAGYTRYGLRVCTAHKIHDTVLREIILSDINAAIQKVSDLDGLFRAAAKRSEASAGYCQGEIASCNSELHRVRKLKKGLYEDYKDEVISKEDYIRYREEYSAREAVLAARLDALNSRKETPVQEFKSNPWVQKLLETGCIEELDRETIVALISYIKVFENQKIEIGYRFSECLDTMEKIALKL